MKRQEGTAFYHRGLLRGRPSLIDKAEYWLGRIDDELGGIFEQLGSIIYELEVEGLTPTQTVKWLRKIDSKLQAVVFRKGEG